MIQFRFLGKIYFILPFLTFAACGDVDEAFRKSKIVDELIPKPPFELLNVSFDDKNVNLGNKFVPLEARNRPKITWKNFKDEEFYTLIMTDVGGKNMEWLHWHVSNILGGDLEHADYLTFYFPSAPPKDTGEHRYVFLLYRQKGKINFNGHIVIPTFEMNGRDTFSTRVFAEKNEFGEPVAGNFFVASWDESVDELNMMIEDYNKRI
jgi:phosphatidylethanolamine-binding protein